MLKSIVAVLVVGLVACGGKSGPCAQRSGAYSVVFSEHAGGTCGSVPEQTIAINAGQAPLPTGCTGNVTASADDCEVTSQDVECPGAQGFIVQQTGVADWSEDGKSGHATLTWNILYSDTREGYCSSTYDATYTKL